MHFEGEHLLAGQIGHFFVLLAFVSSLVATIGYFWASYSKNISDKVNWKKLARAAFYIQFISAIIVFTTIFYICAHHYFEYMYAYKHASKELEPKYLLACIWEGQEGSFLLWAIWHSILGRILMYKNKDWEAPVLSVISLAQFFLFFMLIGIYIGQIRIGSSPFTLTRNEINGPIFSQPNYLSFIKDGVGLNVLLRNYWMVIHPPILFLGFASTIVPFAFAYAGIQTKQFTQWIQPTQPWILLSTCVLGVGIMMGGKWAYESLSFGGYWAWDPVENASLVPWLLLVAGLHTMLIYKATSHSLRASYLFAMLSFIFVLYSTFLTRTGILGDTSVHAFTDAGKAINAMILIFVACFTIPSLGLLIANLKKMPPENKEENTNSREFWMFIGSLVLFMSAMFIIAKTSIPVYNKIFGTKYAPPSDIEFSYNKVLVMVTVILGLLTAVTQYFKYNNTPSKYFIRKIALPTIIALAITCLLTIFYPLTYYKHGSGFLGVIYVALFATIYTVVANANYIWFVLNGKLSMAGGSIAHFGFGLMLIGILISSANKKVISSSKVNGINLEVGKDAMTKQQDNPEENLTLIRQLPTSLEPYTVTYKNDSLGNEKGRRFYSILFERKNTISKNIDEQFTLKPDVYLMKDNNMSSNPDTKSYWNKDIFTYISFAISDDKKLDTTKFKTIEMAVGDTAFYSNGRIVLNAIVKNPNNVKYHYTSSDMAIMADITLISKDSMHYKAMPLIEIDSTGATQIEDTIFAQNMFIKLGGLSGNKFKIGIKESDKLIDFITVKAYIFPYINLVWLGLIIMALGLIMSAIYRAKLSPLLATLALLATGVGLFYMFLFAN